MGTYGLQGVIRAWDLGTLTTEQAIGQILLLLEELHERVTTLESQQNRKKPPPRRRAKPPHNEAS